jgi:hypothetical protein
MKDQMLLIPFTNELAISSLVRRLSRTFLSLQPHPLCSGKIAVHGPLEADLEGSALKWQLIALVATLLFVLLAWSWFQSSVESRATLASTFQNGRTLKSDGFAYPGSFEEVKSMGRRAK